MRLETLDDAKRYLEGLINLERRRDFDYEKLGLGRIRALLRAVGHPERGLPCLHIAGSKGKGTVALAAEVLLRAAGRRVGTYTSPHLESWTQRFRIDGAPVAAQAMVGALRSMLPAVEKLRQDPELRPSFFDVSTALALVLFRELGVDAGVMEVGIGGRLDSTNAVESKVSVITAIQLEHTEKLGNTLEEICGEKAGILRAGVPAAHGPLAAGAYGVLAARAVACNTELHAVGVPWAELGLDGLFVRLEDGRELRAPILGVHQATNLALAVRACELFLGRSLDRLELDALEALQLPARLERFGDTILDCAHTPDSARELRRTLDAVWPGRPWVLVVSIAADKDAARILAELAPPSRVCVVTAAEPVRSLAPEVLVGLARAAGIEDVEPHARPVDALRRAMELAGPDELVVLTGSVYFAGAVRPLLVGAQKGV
jgi:dihydrofolate synthase/folylpolyglutamate synthase